MFWAIPLPLFFTYKASNQSANANSFILKICPRFLNSSHHGPSHPDISAGSLNTSLILPFPLPSVLNAATPLTPLKHKSRVCYSFVQNTSRTFTKRNFRNTFDLQGSHCLFCFILPCYFIFVHSAATSPSLSLDLYWETATPSCPPDHFSNSPLQLSLLLSPFSRFQSLPSHFAFSPLSFSPLVLLSSDNCLSPLFSVYIQQNSSSKKTKSFLCSQTMPKYLK